MGARDCDVTIKEATETLTPSINAADDWSLITTKFRV